MHIKSILAAATAAAAGVLLVATPPASAHSVAQRPASGTCTAIDAPLAMNPIPASADCGFNASSQADGEASMIPAIKPVNPTTKISSTPRAFASTDGDILAITRISGAASGEIAFGGNFAHVITPDGVSHSAKNFAIVSESTGAVLYAGNANTYVRAITSWAGTTYVGGDFTAFGGLGRSHLAAVSPTHSVTSWAPNAGAAVRALAADATGVYVAGDMGWVRKFSLGGSMLWQKPTSKGDGRSLLLYDGALYVGGLFETYAGVTQHGAVKVATATGDLISAFNAHLRADTGVGEYGSYDGEEIIALSVGTTSATLVLGSGGHAPPHMGSNAAFVVDATTGATHWRTSTIGDIQAAAVVGDTVVAGYHRNVSNSTTPYPYFCTQLEGSNGVLTTWDPRITGNQSNADGGNNGVQAEYADPSIKTIFIAGAFTKYANTNTHKSLIAFTWT